MAMGPWTATIDGQAFRVGIDTSVVGTTVFAKIVAESSAAISDGVNVNKGGFWADASLRWNWASSGGLVAIEPTYREWSGARGQTFYLTASITDIYNGLSPEHQVTVTIPALVPSAPATPSVDSVTASSVRVVGAAPANNGSAITGYDVQRATNAAFTAGVVTTPSASPVATITGLAANTQFWFRLRAHNAVGAGGWSPARAATTLPLGPLPQTGLAVARVSDTQQSLSWVRAATTDRPYVSQQVQRRQWSGSTWASWVTIATGIAGTATSYSDSGTTAGRRYEYRLVAVNSAGSSSPSGSKLIETTPGAPSGAAAVKSGADIKVSWVNNPGFPAQVEVWHLPGGGAWELLTTAAAGTASYTHAVPSSSVTHQYRVRHKSATPVLHSAYSTSAVVQLAAPPAAPTALAPVGVVDAVAAPPVLSWQHNSVDTSAQSAFEIQWREQGAPSWLTTGKVVSAASQYATGGTSAIILTNGKTYERQVRTWGQHATASPWSATALLSTSAAPTATINTPADGAVVAASSVTVEWGFFDAEGTPQTAWRSSLRTLPDMAVLASQSGDGPASQVVYDGLVDGGAYRVVVDVQDGSGLWGVGAAADFTVDYAEPPTPTLAGSWDPDTGTVAVTVTNPAAEAGEEDVAHGEVWRSVDPSLPVLWQAVLDAAGDPVAEAVARAEFDAAFSATAHLIAGGVVPGEDGTAAVTDPIPTVAGVNTYRAVAVSALPSSAVSDPITVDTPSAGGWVFLNAGPGFTVMARARAAGKLSTSTGRAKALNRYAGRRLPVETAGEQRTRAGSLSFLDLPSYAADGAATVPEVEALAAMAGPACLRTPMGHRFFVSLGDVGYAVAGIVGEWSVPWTEVDHRE